MAITDHTFTGSAITFGGVAVNPLTDYRHTNQPATVRQTGSTDAMHSYGVGRSNQHITLGFLGSRAPDAGAICSLGVTLNATQETLTIVSAVVSVNISGRKDGEIRGSMTVRPAVTTGTTLSGGSRLNIGFNGTKVVAFGSTFYSSTADAAIIAASYSAVSAEIDDAGAGDASVIITPGLPDRTFTWEAVGGPTLTEGTTGSVAVTWADTGTIGTLAGAIITSVEDGGTLDDVVTTQYTAKETPAGVP